MRVLFLLIPVVIVVLVLVVVLILIVMLVLVVVFILVVIVVIMALQRLHGHQSGRLRVPRNVVVVPLAGKTVEVPGKVAKAAIHAKRAVLAVAVVSPQGVELAGDAIRHLVRDASRVRVDHTANRARTVE